MNDHIDEIQSCVGLLREIAEMSEHASLTGSLSGGAARTCARYNATLLRLIQLGAAPEGLFQPLPESANFGEIGVEARMLASYSTKGKEAEKSRRKGRSGDSGILMRLAPFVDSQDLGMMIREHLKAGQALDLEDLTHLAPFMDRETLGSLVRENLPKPTPPEPVPVPEPPVPPTPPVEDAFDGTTRIHPPIVPIPPETNPSLDELVERLKQPDLAPDDRERILEQMRHASA